ncbi:MAG: 50S ribosomal protein L30 [Rikenellaceae bacterium]
MARILITQVKSRIGATKRQKTNLDSLGLRKVNQAVEHEASPIILGMVAKVAHLVKTEEVK